MNHIMYTNMVGAQLGTASTDGSYGKGTDLCHIEKKGIPEKGKDAKKSKAVLVQDTFDSISARFVDLIRFDSTRSDSI